MRTFAIATAAVSVCMRKLETPAITILPFELVGEEGHGKTRGAQGCTNERSKPSETIFTSALRF